MDLRIATIKYWIFFSLIPGSSILTCNAQEKDLCAPNYLQELQPGKARTWFQQKLKSNPEDAAAMIGLANTLLSFQSTDSAKILFRKVLDADVKNPFALAGLGLVAWMNNDRDSESNSCYSNHFSG